MHSGSIVGHLQLAAGPRLQIDAAQIKSGVVEFVHIAFKMDPLP